MSDSKKNPRDIRDTQKDSIKDTSSMSNSLAPLWQNSFVSNTKINKLITALYMVTDTMDNDEPIRLKLRTLGVEILSAVNSPKKEIFGELNEKITSVLSFLGIAADIGMISEMNCSILKKEFNELRQSIQEFTKKNHFWLEDFVLRSSDADYSIGPVRNASDTLDERSKVSFYKGQGSNRIGVQKGSTLMNALSKVGNKSDTTPLVPILRDHSGFEILKNKRREEIIAIIKDKKNTTGVEGATITDIKNGAKDVLISCGEKTLQRELISMVKDNVLKKTGEKRWSTYSISSL